MSKLIEQLKAINIKYLMDSNYDDYSDSRRPMINQIIINNIVNSKWKYDYCTGSSYISLNHISGFNTDEIKDLFAIENNGFSFDNFIGNASLFERQEVIFSIENNEIYIDNPEKYTDDELIEKFKINIDYSNAYLLEKYEELLIEEHKFLNIKNDFIGLINKAGFTEEQIKNLYSLK